MGVFDDDGHLLKHLFKANVGLLQAKERQRKRRKEGRQEVKVKSHFFTFLVWIFLDLSTLNSLEV